MYEYTFFKLKHSPSLGNTYINIIVGDSWSENNCSSDSELGDGCGICILINKPRRGVADHGDGNSLRVAGCSGDHSTISGIHLELKGKHRNKCNNHHCIVH